MFKEIEEDLSYLEIELLEIGLNDWKLGNKMVSVLIRFLWRFMIKIGMIFF